MYGPYDAIDDSLMLWSETEIDRQDLAIGSLSSTSSDYTCSPPEMLHSTSSPAFITDVHSKAVPIATPASEWDWDSVPYAERLVCWECKRNFGNLRALDKHTQQTLHKAWTCSEAYCDKSYARRDTFLRHRSTHKSNGHRCSVCFKQGKNKVFKRKDHWREHIRSCHPRTADDAKPSTSNHDPACTIESGVDHTSIAAEVSPVQQQQAMKDLVKSLSIVLGDRCPDLIEKLGDKVTAMSGEDMESIAHSMAVSAMAKAYFNAPEK